MGEPHPDIIGRPGVGVVGLWILGSRYKTGVRTGWAGDRKLYSSGSIRPLLLRWVRNVSTWAATSGVVSDVISL